MLKLADIYDSSQSAADNWLAIAKRQITRMGAQNLIERLTYDTDFLHAPASTRYHSSYDGGLCRHSIHVYIELMRLCELYDITVDNPDTIALVSLCHDICKTDYYTVSYRNVKNEHGVWERVPFYTVDDRFPLGHGEKSVFMLQRYMKLTDDEALAVRWHMGGFDDASRGGSYAVSTAFDKCPLALMLHMADMAASHYREVLEDECK